MVFYGDGRRFYRKGVSIVLDSYRMPLPSHLAPIQKKKEKKERKKEREEEMESFEQSYATLPQDLVGNLRPAAREIGFARSLRFSLYLSPSIFSRPLNEIAQSFVSRLLPVSDRVSPRSFICHSAADRFACLSIFHPSLLHCLTLLSRYSKAGIDSVWRGGARGQSKGNF